MKYKKQNQIGTYDVWFKKQKEINYSASVIATVNIIIRLN